MNAATEKERADDDRLKKLESASASSIFTDGNWGFGLAVLNRRGNASVDDATLVNNTVQVTSSQSWVPRLVLERHYFPTGGDSKGECVSESWGSWKSGVCIGPFIGVGLGANQVIDFVGGGVMFGFGEKSRSDVKNTRSHNVGIGVGRQFNVRVLGNGIEDGSALPAGETQIRYRTIDAPVFFIMYSYAP